MLEVLRRTWCPALLFGLVALLFEVIVGPVPPLPSGVVTLYIICVVPPVWWYTGARRGPVSPGRGALIGALCGALIAILPATLLTIILNVKPADGSTGLLTAAAYVVLLLAGVGLTGIGAGIGALVSLLERSRI